MYSNLDAVYMSPNTHFGLSFSYLLFHLVYDHRCQVLHHNTGGICVTECSRNGDCKYGEICCSNNCGGVCRPSSMTG